jgi:hypothetical protein
MNWQVCGETNRRLIWVIIPAFARGTEENRKILQVRMTSLRAEIPTRDLPNTKQER